MISFTLTIDFKNFFVDLFYAFRAILLLITISCYYLRGTGIDKFKTNRSVSFLCNRKWNSLVFILCITLVLA